jgi:serine/threonine protein kinase
MIGQLLNDRYRLEAEQGRGGTGVVYRAYDTLLSRSVAIKVLSASGLRKTGKDRLLAEARAAARLNHPNIVSIYDAGEAVGVLFIVMELVEGQTLRVQPPDSLDATLRFACQICAALDHAHTCGIIHHDIKPENIIVTETRNAKLMDFGLAHSVDAPDLSEKDALVGTLAYLAPELIQGQSASVQSDLYALGWCSMR